MGTLGVERGERLVRGGEGDIKVMGDDWVHGRVIIEA